MAVLPFLSRRESGPGLALTSTGGFFSLPSMENLLLSNSPFSLGPLKGPCWGLRAEGDSVSLSNTAVLVWDLGW